MEHIFIIGNSNGLIVSNNLIIVMGLPGTGKTYFARALAQHIGASHFNSDVTRKVLSREPGYSSREKGDVYDKLYRDVKSELAAGRTVVLDATFSLSKYREPYMDLATRLGYGLHIILIEADEALIKERVSVKRPDSDADFEVYKKIKSEYEKIEQDHTMIESGKDNLKEMIASAMDYIQRDNQL
ncbi:MAG: AAA family ATPase [Flavobacteriales bacterium]|nr:AAA family ATPase [Flavobacteriales bacterium]